MTVAIKFELLTPPSNEFNSNENVHSAQATIQTAKNTIIFGNIVAFEIKKKTTNETGISSLSSYLLSHDYNLSIIVWH